MVMMLSWVDVDPSLSTWYVGSSDNTSPSLVQVTAVAGEWVDVQLREKKEELAESTTCKEVTDGVPVEIEKRD